MGSWDRRRILMYGLSAIGGSAMFFPGGGMAMRAQAAEDDPYVPPASRFENSLDGWRLVHRASLDDYSRPEPDFFFAEHLGAAHFTMTDADPPGELAFLAPPPFSGGHLPVYNGFLTFKMGVGNREADPKETQTVQLRGAGMVLSHPLNRPIGSLPDPLPEISIRLNENSGWLAANQEAPSRAEFRTVLDNLEALLLPASWQPEVGVRHAETFDDVAYVLPGGGEIAVSRLSVNFGRVRLRRSERFQILVKNVSRVETNTLRVSPELLGDADFTVSHQGEEINIDPRGFLRLWVRFRPGSLGRKTATLRITHTDPSTDTPVEITIRGVGRKR